MTCTNEVRRWRVEDRLQLLVRESEDMAVLVGVVPDAAWGQPRVGDTASRAPCAQIHSLPHSDVIENSLVSTRNYFRATTYGCGCPELRDILKFLGLSAHD